MEPFGERLGDPSAQTVAAKPSLLLSTIAFMSAVNMSCPLARFPSLYPLGLLSPGRPRPHAVPLAARRQRGFDEMRARLGDRAAQLRSELGCRRRSDGGHSHPGRQCGEVDVRPG